MKNVLITGANGGIGQALITRLGALGVENFTLFFGEDRPHGTAIDVEDENVAASVGSVANPEDVDRCVSLGIERFGTLDALFNVAGVALPGSVLTASQESWTQSWDSNVMGVINFSRAAYPHLRQTGGRVVNISSIWGVQPTNAMTPYSASKYALQGIAGAMTSEFADGGVRVSTVILDKVDTAFRQHMPGPDFDAQQLAKMLRPEDVAEACAWLTTTSPVANVSSLRLDAWQWK